MAPTATTLHDELQTLKTQTASGSAVALQSTLAVAARAAEQALRLEEEAQAAALSLAQREALEEMTTELREAGTALDEALELQRRCVKSTTGSAKASLPKGSFAQKLSLRALDRRPAEAPRRPSWWAACTAAMQALESGMACLEALAAGQPSATPAHAVADATAGLLRDHRDRLRGYAVRLAA